MRQLRDEGTGVSQGWRAQAAITKHQTGDLTGIYYSQFWRIRSPKSRAPLSRFLVKAFFLAFRRPSSYCVLTRQREKEESSLVFLLRRALIPS